MAVIISMNAQGNVELGDLHEYTNISRKSTSSSTDVSGSATDIKIPTDRELFKILKLDSSINNNQNTLDGNDSADCLKRRLSLDRERLQVYDAMKNFQVQEF